MGAGFPYRNLAILRLTDDTSLVISDVLFRRNQSQRNCFGGNAFRLFDWQVRYLDIYLFYVSMGRGVVSLTVPGAVRAAYRRTERCQ